MNSPDFSDLKNAMREFLGETHGQKASGLMDQFERDGKILVLNPKEVQVLEAFRRWCGSNASATGVFHYRNEPVNPARADED